jgi:putative flippase GtrA
MTWTDSRIAIFLGMATGACVFATVGILHEAFAAWKYLPLVILGPIIMRIGLAFGVFLGRYRRIYFEFSKFAIVGFFNASIDFLMLNALSHVTGVTAGFKVGGINIPGVLLVITSSYLLNKIWVFGENETMKSDSSHGDPGLSAKILYQLRRFVWLFRHSPRFVIITGGSIFFNSLAMVFFTSPRFFPLFDIPSDLWLNVAKIFVSAGIMVWNFLGYKYIVFRTNLRGVDK